MTNQIGMVTCYSPYGKVSRGQRFGIAAQLRLWWRRRQRDDLEHLRGGGGL